MHISTTVTTSSKLLGEAATLVDCRQLTGSQSAARCVVSQRMRGAVSGSNSAVCASRRARILARNVALDMSPSNGPLTTHVLDTSTGKPAAGMHLELRCVDRPDVPTVTRVCGPDGRCPRLVESEHCTPGVYSLRFYASKYYARSGVDSFYPYCDITFTITAQSAADHFHVPLIISPHGFTTYRGS
jgi:5-hydroxyisourate hydrolase